MTLLAIIGALAAAIAGYVWGRWDGERHGIQIMRDEYDELRAGVAPTGDVT